MPYFYNLFFSRKKNKTNKNLVKLKYTFKLGFSTEISTYRLGFVTAETRVFVKKNVDNLTFFPNTHHNLISLLEGKGSKYVNLPVLKSGIKRVENYIKTFKNDNTNLLVFEQLQILNTLKKNSTLFNPIFLKKPKQLGYNKQQTSNLVFKPFYKTGFVQNLGTLVL